MAEASLRGIKLFNLSGRSAVITGGSKGLGLAMAAGLASAGADLMLVSRHLEEAQAAAQSLAQEYGVLALGHAADVRSEVEVDGIVKTALSAFGKVDILINSAGINIRGPITSLKLEEFERVLGTNVTGTWLTCRAVLPSMRAQGWGRIINISSALGVIGLPGRTPYTASKGAVLQMTRTLALECASDGITVNAICPGFVQTDMIEGFRAHADILGIPFEQVMANGLARVPIKRFLKPDEIGHLAVYLGSTESDGMTGQSILLDGGMLVV